MTATAGACWRHTCSTSAKLMAGITLWPDASNISRRVSMRAFSFPEHRTTVDPARCSDRVDFCRVLITDGRPEAYYEVCQPNQCMRRRKTRHCQTRQPAECITV